MPAALDDLATPFHAALAARREPLLDRARRPPLHPRATLATADGVPIGSVEPAVARALADAGLPLRHSPAGETAPGAAADASLPAWRVADDTAGGLTPALARIARWLADHGHAGRWRDEALAVVGPDGREHGRVERGVVRVLGLTTFAVHLVGFTTAADGSPRQWVQQRALDKATDPGLWDTLMGGQCGAGESLAETLARETWEEAGLRMDALQGLRDAGRVTLRRPVREGYLVEHIDLFEALVPPGLAPVNRDGEVERFEALDAHALAEREAGGLFTLEAGLVMARATGAR